MICLLPRGSTRGKSLLSDKICLLPIEDQQGENSLQSDKICVLPIEAPQGEKPLQSDKICVLPIEDPQGENHYSNISYVYYQAYGR